MIYFRQLYYDDDTKEFGVDKCISSDDTLVTRRTIELQEKGRNVRCCTTDSYKKPEQVPSFERCIIEDFSEYKYNSSLKW